MPSEHVYNVAIDGSAYQQLVILAAEVGCTTSEAAARSIRLALRMRSLMMAMHGIVMPVGVEP